MNTADIRDQYRNTKWIVSRLTWRQQSSKDSFGCAFHNWIIKATPVIVKSFGYLRMIILVYCSKPQTQPRLAIKTVTLLRHPTSDICCYVSPSSSSLSTDGNLYHVDMDDYFSNISLFHKLYVELGIRAYEYIIFSLIYTILRKALPCNHLAAFPTEDPYIHILRWTNNLVKLL